MKDYAVTVTSRILVEKAKDREAAVSAAEVLVRYRLVEFLDATDPDTAVQAVDAEELPDIDVEA